MTPTRPVPADASGFNFAISVNWTLNELTLRPAGTPAEADDVVVVDAALGVLLHAAAVNPTTTTRDIPAS
jgi:hypothetical protein